MANINLLDPRHVEKKLQSVSNSLESIQSLSMWALNHKAQHEQVVAIWFQVLKTANMELRLSLFYLCNEIVQTCRRRHAVMFKDAFKEVLKDASLLVRDPTVRSSIERIFKIWQERNVYDEPFVGELLAALNNTKVKSSLSSKLLADFHPEHLMRNLSQMVELEEQVELRRLELPEHIWSREEINAHKQQLKNRNQGQEFVKEIDKTRSEYLKYVTYLEEERTQRRAMILMLEQSELFYDAQLGECNIVTTAYKNYSAKVNQVRKRLWEFIHPEEREMEQKRKKRKKSKSVEDGDATCTTKNDGMANDSVPIQNGSSGREGAAAPLPHTQPPPLPLSPAPPPPPMEMWSSPDSSTTVTATTTLPKPGENQHHQQDQSFHPQHFQVQQQHLQFLEQQLQKQAQQHFQQPVVLEQQSQQQVQQHALPQQQQQQQVQHFTTPYSTTTTTTAPKAVCAASEDGYEMNHYEIGGEDCTPVYDEDAQGSGGTTPVQDEDPSDIYIPSRDKNKAYSNLKSFEENLTHVSGFFSTRFGPPGASNLPTINGAPNPQAGYTCLPATPDLSKPPPLFNIFLSPPSVPMPKMINNTRNQGSTTGQEQPGELTPGQGFQQQVMSLVPGVFPLTMPPPNSSSSPVPQFGMIPIRAASLSAQQQQQLSQPLSNFSQILPSFRQPPMVPQLSVPPPSLPFQQQILSPPPIISSLHALQQQPQQSPQQQQQQQQQSQHLHAFSPTPATLQHPSSLGGQKPDEFSSKSSDLSPSSSFNAIPILDRSLSTNEMHYQLSNQQESYNSGHTRIASLAGNSTFFPGSDASGGSATTSDVKRGSKHRVRVNPNNLTQVRTIENMSTTNVGSGGYYNPNT